MEMLKRLLFVFTFISFTQAYSQCIESIPYTEDFESTVWVVPATNPAQGGISTCWNRGTTNDIYWRPDSGPTGQMNTGPNSDHTTGSGKYLHIESDNSVSNSNLSATITSPWIDLVGVTSPELRFWRHMYGFQISSLTVQYQTKGSTSWSTLGSLSGSAQTSSSDSWVETVYSLASVNDTIRLRFTGARTSTFGFLNQIALDDISVQAASTCSRPNSFNVQSRTQTSITLSWFSSNTNGAIIRYLEVGQPLSSAVETNVGTTNPATISGLKPSTEYTFWVRDSCGVGDLGSWEGPISTNTLCGVVMAPYFEGFEGPAFAPPTSFGALGGIHPCWIRSPITSAGYTFIAAPQATISTNSGPNTGHNSSKWITSDRVSFNSTTSSSLRTPKIDLSALANPELRFWYFMYGSSISKLEVEIKTSTTAWQKVKTITGQQQFSKNDAWKEDFISLSAYSNQSVFIRFTAFNNGTIWNAQIALDDISVDEAPPCPRPNPFTLSGVTSTTATFAFTSSGTSPWQIEYGPTGFSPGAGNIQNVSSNPATINGLTPQTSYDFYIRDTCGAQGVSLWTGPLNVTTSCSPSSSPFVENFDGAGFVSGPFGSQGTFPSCWTATDNSNNYFWTPSPPAFSMPTTGPSSAHSGVDYIYTDGGFSTSPNDTAVIVTPSIDLSTLTIPELSYWYHMFGSEIHSLKLQVSTGSSWVTISSITGQNQNSKSDAWKKEIVNLSSYAGQTVQFRFIGKRNSTFGSNLQIALDDIDIHEQPACPAPTGLSFVGRSQTSINLSWITGSATSWVIEYGFEGFSLGSGTVLTGVSSSPYNVTGLLPSTAYDFYIYSDCGTNGNSTVTGPFTATTVCGPIPAPYVENFESPAWTIGNGFNDPGDLKPCWIRSDTVSYIWTLTDQETFPTTSGPSEDHTPSPGTRYMYLDVRSFANDEATLRTPAIDVSPLDTPQLRFFYHMYGNSIVHLKVEVSTATSPWSTVWTKTGQQQTSNTAPWQEAIVDLTSYQGQTIFIRFKGKRSTTSITNSEIAIDDISIDEKPNCPAPSALTAVAVSETSVQISWTTGGGGNSQIEYGPVGFAPGSGTVILAPTNPFIVNGLSGNTTYDFYVRDSCSAGGVSWAAGPITTSTFPCANACFYELILSDSFGNGWNAGGFNPFHQLQIDVDGNSTNYTLASGSSQTFWIPICDSLPFTLTFFNNGFQSNQCGIVLKDPSGTTLFSRLPSSTIILNSGLLFTGSGSCAQNCDDPVGLTIANITQTSADALWSSVSGDARIAYGLAGFTPTSPTQSGLSTSYGITSLTPGTTYDVYVQDTCSNGLLSTWVGPVQFTTLNCSVPTASFTASSNGFNATFDGSASSQNTVTHTWYFGDGNSGSGMLESHVYTAPGIYQVILVAANACGLLDSSTQTLVVCGFPSAVMNSSSNGLNATFDGSSSVGVGMSYTWDFGDGNVGTGMNAGNTYLTAGTYSVLLIVTDTCGSADTTSQVITVCNLPLPSFTETISGMSVQFDASGTTGATGYDWDFGDGNTDSGVNTSHTYLVNQNYTVTLRVYNSCGDTVTFQKVIALCVAPIANWTYTIISSSGNGMLVQFDATASTGNNYSWNFGDGNTLTGANYPTHLYTTPGLFYLVTLIVSNDCGDSDTLSYKLNQIGIVEHSNLDGLVVYPNPSDGFFVLKLSDDPSPLEEIALLSIDGKLITPKVSFSSLGNDQYEIQITQPPGNYLIRVKSGSNYSFKEIVIQH